MALLYVDYCANIRGSLMVDANKGAPHHVAAQARLNDLGGVYQPLRVHEQFNMIESYRGHTRVRIHVGLKSKGEKCRECQQRRKEG